MDQALSRVGPSLERACVPGHPASAAMADMSAPDSPVFDVLVLDGHAGTALRVVQALAMGRQWRIHVLAWSRTLEVPVHLSRFVTSFRNAGRPASDAELIETILMTVRDVGARVVLPLTEPTGLLCARHRERIGRQARLAPLADAAALEAAIDKVSLAGLLRQHGIPAPRTWVPAATADFCGEIPAWAFPVLVKPSRCAFGIGIRRANDAAELRQIVAVQEAGAKFVVQQFVPGEDVDCSVLALDGRIVASTVQAAIAPAEREFAPASRIRFVDDAPVRAIADRLVRALGWSGIAHIDLRRAAATGELFVLEVNARIWGSMTASVAAGVNFPDLACRAALGLATPEAGRRNIRFTTSGLGLRPLLRHLLRRPDGFRFAETNLPFVLRDPWPVVLQECANRLQRLRGRLRVQKT